MIGKIFYSKIGKNKQIISKTAILIQPKLTLVFHNQQKMSILNQNLHTNFFRVLSFLCNNVPYVQHFFGEFMCCTLGTTGISHIQGHMNDHTAGTWTETWTGREVMTSRNAN